MASEISLPPSLFMSTALTLCSANVRGLKQRSQAAGCRKLVTSNHIDIVCIQESHLASESEINTVFRELEGEVYYSLAPHNNAFTGVCT